MNRLVSLLVFICLTSFTYTYAGGSGQGATVHTLVIDPGHGGMDPGAIGPGGHHEADLALAVSLKFGEMVKQAFPNVKIIYTRTTDKFVSLADRADMANKAKADLFICIHLNSATNAEAYGTSTYVLGLHRTDANLEIAKRENAVIELEGDKDKNYEFDPNSPEGHIIMSMKQNAFLDQSTLLASKIEEELAVLSKRKSRGVKQAGFWVLYKTAMPSLLAEIGFISNPTEEQYLSTDQGQTNIANSIFKAFRSYKIEIEGGKDTNTAAGIEKKTEVAAPVAQSQNPSKESNPSKTQEAIKPAPQPTENKQPVSQNNPPAKKEEKAWEPEAKAIVKEPEPAKTPTEEPKPALSSDQATAQSEKTQSSPESTAPKTEKKVVVVKEEKTEPAAPKPKETVKPKEEKTTASTPKAEPKPAVKPKEDKPVALAKPEPKPAATPVKETPKSTEPAQSEPKPTATTQASGKESVYFTVQLMAAKNKQSNYDDLVNTFGLIDREDIGNGIVRYMAGEFASFGEAKKALELAHSKGIKDAFIVGYLNKKRQDGKATYQLGLKYP